MINEPDKLNMDVVEIFLNLINERFNRIQEYYMLPTNGMEIAVLNLNNATQLIWRWWPRESKNIKIYHPDEHYWLSNMLGRPKEKSEDYPKATPSNIMKKKKQNPSDLGNAKLSKLILMQYSEEKDEKG